MARAVVNIANGNIGDIRHSMLTLAQFQAINGTGWVLMDGSSCVGTAYATLTGNTTLPDARGMVLRGKSHSRADGKQNPDGDSSLGAYQADHYGSHGHTFQWYFDPAVTGLTSALLPGGELNKAGMNANNNTANRTATNAVVSSGGNETRMKNITVNIFIKVN